MSITASGHASAIVIRSGQGDYAVESLPSLAQLSRAIGAIERAHLFVDERVAALYPTLLDGVDPTRVHRAPATEEEKTLGGVERLARFLQETNASKDATLVVIGGGIVQDVGAFAAHVYYRGIPYVLVPTTLLSMADSCIGAKTGVNLGAFKNQLGFFQSPSRVLAWSGFLKTLEPDAIRSGFGEILKLAIIGGSQPYARFREYVNQFAFEVDGIDEIIFDALRVKQRIIEEDEYEKNLRKILNYGHTFGHALEGVTEHEVPHGLAVAWGVDVANYIAMRTGLLSLETFDDLHDVVAARFKLTLRRKVKAGDLIAKMRRDKKATGNSVRLVLAAGIGDMRLIPTALDEHLEALIVDYLRMNHGSHAREVMTGFIEARSCV
jgi:3-dehydroquinate synthase